MSSARNDRNSVQFGPARSSLEYKLDRLEEEVRQEIKNETTSTTQNITNYITEIINEGAAVPFVEVGTVTDYDVTQNISTRLRGLELTVEGDNYGLSDKGLFYNATGFGLRVGDQVTLWPVARFGEAIVFPPVDYDEDGNFDEVMYAAVSRVKRVDPFPLAIFYNPQANNNFPYDGDYLPTPHNPLVNASSTTFSPTVSITKIRGFYAEGVLGYVTPGGDPERIVVMIGDPVGTATAQPPITIYNVESGTIQDINRLAAVGATNRTRALAAIGNRLFVTYDGTSGNCVESLDVATGLWSPHNISHAVFAGVSDGRAWWVGFTSGGSRYRVHSIDQFGTHDSIDYPTTIAFNGGITATASSYIFAKAKNGKIWVDIDTTSGSQVMAVGDTAGGAGTIAWSTFATPNDLPWSRVGNGAGTTNYYDMTTAETFSDIDSSGNLYYLTRTGTPTTWGFAIINVVSKAIVRYGSVTSATGNVADGEIAAIGGMALFGSEVVMFGSVQEDIAVFPTAGRATSHVPAYWRTDGFASFRVYDPSYVGLSSGTSGDAACFARVIPSYGTTSSVAYVHNLSTLPFGAGSPPAAAKTTGPCVINRLTVAP